MSKGSITRSTYLSYTKALDRLLHVPGARIMLMHTREGLEHFVVPGGRLRHSDAVKIKARPDCQPFDDGLFPGNPQSFRLVR